jgi:hypothetical protein
LAIAPQAFAYCLLRIAPQALPIEFGRIPFGVGSSVALALRAGSCVATTTTPCAGSYSVEQFSPNRKGAKVFPKHSERLSVDTLKNQKSNIKNQTSNIPTGREDLGRAGEIISYTQKTLTPACLECSRTMGHKPTPMD